MTKAQPGSDTAAAPGGLEQECRENTWKFNGIQEKNHLIAMFLTHWGGTGWGLGINQPLARAASTVQSWRAAGLAPGGVPVPPLVLCP